MILIIIILAVNKSEEEEDTAGNDVGVGESASVVSKEGNYDKI